MKDGNPIITEFMFATAKFRNELKKASKGLESLGSALHVFGFEQSKEFDRLNKELSDAGIETIKRWNEAP